MQDSGRKILFTIWPFSSVSKHLKQVTTRWKETQIQDRLGQADCLSSRAMTLRCKEDRPACLNIGMARVTLRGEGHCGVYSRLCTCEQRATNVLFDDGAFMQFYTRNSLHTRTANDLTNLNPFRHMVQHTNILKERTDLEPRFKKLQYEYGQHLVLVLSKVV